MEDNLLIYEISDSLGRFSVDPDKRPIYTLNLGYKEDRELAYEQFLRFGSFWAQTNYVDLTHEQKELLPKIKELQYINKNIFEFDTDFYSLNDDLRFALIDFTKNGKRTILLVDSGRQIFPKFTTEIINYPPDFLNSVSIIDSIKKDLIDSAFLDKDGRNDKLQKVLLKINNLSQEISEEEKELLKDIVSLLISENLGIKKPAQTKTKPKAKVMTPEPEIKVIKPEPELEDEIIDFEALMEQELDFSSMMDDILNDGELNYGGFIENISFESLKTKDTFIVKNNKTTYTVKNEDYRTSPIEYLEFIKTSGDPDYGLFKDKEGTIFSIGKTEFKSSLIKNLISKKQ